MRFDPYREIDRLGAQTASPGRLPVMPMDAFREGDTFVVHFDLPGVDAETVELTVERNVLTVTAQRAWRPAAGQEVVVAERPQGTFSRQLFLGEGLDPDRIEAHYDQGVLTVTIPIAESAKPRKVEVNAGNGGGASIPTTAASG
jgi:HSP20 family protein